MKQIVVIITAFLCFLIFGLCPISADTFNWDLSAEDLSLPGQDAGGAEVTINNNGDAAAIWGRSNGANTVIQVSRYSSSTKTWTAPEDLAVKPPGGIFLYIAINDTGNIVAVWTGSDGSNNILEASYYSSAASTWSTVENLSAAGQDSTHPRAAIDDAGNAIVVWSRFNSVNWIVQSSRYSTATGIWSGTDDLSDTGQDADYPHLAINDEGDAFAVWCRSDGVNGVVQASRYSSSVDIWYAPTNLSASGPLNPVGPYTNLPDVAMDNEGNAIVGWFQSDGTDEIIQVSHFAVATTTWSAAVDLSAPGQDAAPAVIAMNDAGEAVAAWKLLNGMNWIIQASSFSPDTGDWSDPADLSESGENAVYPGVGMDETGVVVVVWQRSDGFNGIIQESHSPDAGQIWSVPKDLSEAGQDAWFPKVAMSRHGDSAVVTWYRSDGLNTIIQAVILEIEGDFSDDDDRSRTDKGSGFCYINTVLN